MVMRFMKFLKDKLQWRISKKLKSKKWQGIYCKLWSRTGACSGAYFLRTIVGLPTNLWRSSSEKIAETMDRVIYVPVRDSVLSENQAKIRLKFRE